MSDIHPTAIIAGGAQLGAAVRVGPYCVIGDQVRLGDRVELKSHAVLDGDTSLGDDCIIFPFASVGGQTQDLKFKGGASRVEIGAGTTLREYVTVNAATSDGDATTIGERCHIMAYAHIAHDCHIGNEVILANAATMAGHVEVQDQAIIGGLCGVHQFVRVGRQCIVGGCSKVTQDVPPFMMADGHPLKVRGVNKIGLERRGVSEEARHQLKEAYRLLYRKELTPRQAVEQIRDELTLGPELVKLLEFIESSERGITR